MRQPHDHINWRNSSDITPNMPADLTTDSEIIMNLFENDHHNSSSTSNSTQKNKSTINRGNTNNKKDIENNPISQTPTPYSAESNYLFPSSLANSIMNSTPLNFMKQYPLPNQYYISTQQQGQLNQLYQPQPQQGLQQSMNFNFDSPQFDNFFTFTPNQTQKIQISNQKPQSRPHSRAQQHYNHNHSYNHSHNHNHHHNHHRQSLTSQRSQFNIPNDATFGLSPNLSTPLANKSSLSMFDTPYLNNLFMNNPNNAINIDSNQMSTSNSQFSKILMNVDTPLLDSIEKVLINSTPLPKVNNQKIKKLNNSSNIQIDDYDPKDSSFNKDCIYKVVESTRLERCQDIIQIPTSDKRTPKKQKSILLVSSTPVRNNNKLFSNDGKINVKNNNSNNKLKSNIDESFDNSDENKNNIIINSSPSTIVVSSASKSISRYTISHSLNVDASPTPVNKFNNYSQSMSFNMSSINNSKNIDFNIDPSLQSNNIPEAPVMGVFKEKNNKSLRKHSTFPSSQNVKLQKLSNEPGNIFTIQSVNNNVSNNVLESTKKLNRSESMPDSIMNKNNKKRKNGSKGGIQFVMTDVTKLKGNKKRRVVQTKKTIPLSNTTNIINNNSNIKGGKLEIHKRMHTFKTKNEPQFINQEFKEKEKENVRM